MSCDKKPINEDIPVVNPEGGDETDPADGPRVITVSFDTKATRTELGPGYKPEFCRGDMIAVALFDTTISDPETDIEKCPVSIDEKGIATITPKLKGKLKAVYPAKYARVVNGELTYFVPSAQTGYFEDANICMTTIENNSKSAVFYNQTAIFVVAVSSDTKYLEVTSLRSIDPSTGQRYLNDDELSAKKYYYRAICDCMRNDNNYEDVIVDYTKFETYEDGAGREQVLEKGRKIKIGNGSNSLPDTCYVSIMVNDNVLLRDLNFDAQNRFGDDSYGVAGTMGGFSPVFLENCKPKSLYDEKVQIGKIYTGVANHLHDYVAGGYLCWATMNVGASSSDPNGLYFAWGETTGHKWNATVNQFEDKNGDLGYSFNWESSPFPETLSDEVKAKFPVLVDPNNQARSFNTLPLQYDAAYQNWGGAWRMPRSFDFLSLKGQGGGFIFNNYVAISDVRGSIDFSNVGYGNGETRSVPNTTNCRSSYWTSTLSSDTAAYYLNVYTDVAAKNTATTMNPFGFRYIGHAIRPVVGTEYE